jgi:arylformamidase
VKFESVIDLSHPLRPGQEARRLEIERLEATQITGADSEQDWYIMHRVVMDNHMGTHLEVPYHCFPEAADLAQVPVQQFVGEAAILDLRGYSAHEAIPLKAVQRAAEKCGGVREGDIVFVMTGWSKHYGSEQYMTPPFLSREALCWLMDQGVKMLGVDTTGAMDPNSPDRWNHLPIFEAGAVYIENLTNLEAVPRSRVTVVALPPAIEGLEGVTVRVVALV